MRLIDSLSIKFQIVGERHPFGCEICYTWQEAGEERHALTRIAHAPGSVEFEKAEFMRRNGMRSLR